MDGTAVLTRKKGKWVITEVEVDVVGENAGEVLDMEGASRPGRVWVEREVVVEMRGTVAGAGRTLRDEPWIGSFID